MKRTFLLPFTFMLAACSADEIPSEDPLKRVSGESYHLQLNENKVIDRDKRIHWLQEYVTGYRAPDGGDTPASVVAFRPSTSCKPSVRSGSMIAQVLTDHSGTEAPLYGMDADEVDRLGTELHGIVSNNRTPRFFFGKEDGHFGRIDVIVTDTSAPLHLVLAARNMTLWNIQKAEGVNITGITLVAELPGAAVANVDPDVPVTALVGDAAKRCGALPAVEPVESYPGIRMQLHKAVDNDAKWKKSMAAYRTYNGFFKSAFDVSSAEVSTTISALVHAAIGPAPQSSQDRMAYEGLKGANIRVTQMPFLVYGKERDNTNARREAAIAAADERMGGDHRAMLEQMGY